MPTGEIIKNVPEGTTRAQLQARFDKHSAASSPSTTAAPEAKGQSWLDTAGTAITHIPESAGNLIGGLVQAVAHPIDTAVNIRDVLDGVSRNVAEKVLPKAATEYFDKAAPFQERAERSVQSANAMGDFYKERYGSEEGFKKALSEDPVGVAADASIFFGGAANLASKSPQLAKLAAIADKAANITNPVALGATAIKATVKGAGKLASETLGVSTGAGSLPIRTAYQAGKEGGAKAKAFQQNMRGDVAAESVVDDAKIGLRNLRGERGKQYRDSMADIGSDPAVIDFGGIDRAVGNVSSVKNYKGIDISDSTAGIRDKIGARIKQWKELDPAEYHTVEGMDALKQAIGDIRDSTPFNTPERIVADNAYHAVRSEIIKQAPQYAKTMKAYEEASDEIRNIERTLSLNPKANVDTALRKLQSVMRDNVNTNYGNRGELAAMLVDAGASNLMEKLAGQSLKSPTSRGLGKLLMGGELGAGVVSVFLGHPGTAMAIAPALASQSPRLAGEAAYYFGKASRMSKAGKYLPSASAVNVGGRIGQMQPVGAQ